MFNCWETKIIICQYKETCKDLSLNPRNLNYEQYNMCNFLKIISMRIFLKRSSRLSTNEMHMRSQKICQS